MIKIISTNNADSIIKKSLSISAVKNAQKKSFNVLGKKLVKTAVDEINYGVKTGRVYNYNETFINYKGELRTYENYSLNMGIHTASAVGEPLANVTGDAKRSITYFIDSNNNLVFGSDCFYLVDWELSPKAPRPTLEFAVNKNTNIFSDEYIKNITKYFDKIQ